MNRKGEKTLTTLQICKLKDLQWSVKDASIKEFYLNTASSQLFEDVNGNGRLIGNGSAAERVLKN